MKLWLKGCLHGDLSARSYSLAKRKGQGGHPRGGLHAALAALRRAGPTRRRLWQAARPRDKPRARGRLQSVATSGRVPEARQVHSVPAACNVVPDPQRVQQREARESGRKYRESSRVLLLQSGVRNGRGVIKGGRLRLHNS